MTTFKVVWLLRLETSLVVWLKFLKIKFRVSLVRIYKGKYMYKENDLLNLNLYKGIGR